MSTVTPDASARPAARCPFDHHAIADVTNAWPAYDELREHGVAWSPDYDGFFVLSRHEHVMAALRDPDTFVSGHGTRIPVVGSGRVIPVDSDPPEHTAYRGLISQHLSPAFVRGLTDALRTLIDGLVDDFHARGGGDWVAEVGLPLPLNVLVAVVGFAPDTVTQFRALTEQSWRVISQTDLLEARAGLRALVRDELARHRAERPDDYITWLLDRRVEERAVTDDELERILLAFAVAGHETTMNASGSMLRLLADDPDRQTRLRENPELIPAFVEECLRFTSPVHSMARYAARDAEIDGVAIPAGSRVLLLYAAANRDATRFDHAGEFDPDRSVAGHLAFGFGRHQCPGALLARTELRLICEKLVTLPPVAYAGEPDFGGLTGGAMNGPDRLPLRFTDSNVETSEGAA